MTPLATSIVPELAFDGVSRRFGSVVALADVSFAVAQGEVVALCGENGAGKSTLLGILAGELEPDGGSLMLAGRAERFTSPAGARAHRVRVVHQEPEIVRDISIAENLFLGELPQRGRMFDRAKLNRDAAAALAELGLDADLDPTMRGHNLSSAQRQLLEIARAVRANPRVIALDEPTSALTEEQVQRLLALVRRLRARDVAIVYVSHRLREVLDIADRIVVLRDGRVTLDTPSSSLTQDTIIRAMVGRSLSTLFPDRRVVSDDHTVLSARGLTTDWITDVDLTVRRGEVVGLAGLMGAGRSEVARVLFGDIAPRAGRISLHGRSVSFGSPREAMRAGIAFVPEDRKKDALFLQRSVGENIAIAVLRALQRFRFVRGSAERRLVDDFQARLRIKAPSSDVSVAVLSGGNQQKVVFARWLATKPRLLILDEPTRGIDVATKMEIYRLIDELARSGVAILFISSELPELIGMSDRIAVLRNGRIAGEVSGSQATEETILRLALMDADPVVTPSAPPRVNS
jgi:ABC-type sugar transport system ATPase subunit